MVDANRVLNVLELLFAAVFKRYLKAIPNVIANRLRNGDATRLRHTFKARGHIHAVAVDVVAFDNDVAQINPDAELDRALRCSRAHRGLNLRRAGDSVHHARKLGQHTVTGEFNNAAAMLGDLGIDYFLPDLLELSQRPGFVMAHQPAVPDDIGSENCSKTAFHFINNQLFRASVEESRYAIFKVPRRDPSAALGMTVLSSPLHNGAGPGQSTTEYHHQHIIAGFYPTRAVRFIERDRHRR